MAWYDTAWNYTQKGAGWIANNAGGLGALAMGGAALYSAFNQPDPPPMPEMPTMPQVDMSGMMADITSSMDSYAMNLSDNYKTLLEQATAVGDQYKLDEGGDTGGDGKDTQRRLAAKRKDVKTDRDVWESYAPIQYVSLLGGSN